MKVVQQKHAFRHALISWYLKEKRDLPWRQTDDPYAIWVSEVMLQQTRVDTVIPYYERFLKKFPTLQHLAEADEEDLLKMWEGLGYYARARNLQAGAQEVLASYNGRIPQTRKELSTLKGVGPYTAGAILSIAFNQPAHAVDGNVMRVLARLLMIEEDIGVPKNRKIFEQIVMELIDPKEPSSFNQGLMELGAMVCTPTNPSCLLCPVRDFCVAYDQGMQEVLPIKKKKTKVKTVHVSYFLLQDQTGRIIVTQRPKNGLLANLWEFPMIETNQKEEALLKLEEKLGIRVNMSTPLLTFKHLFTHIVWHIQGYVGVLDPTSELTEACQLVSIEEALALPKPVPITKLLTEFQRQQQTFLL